MKAKRDGHHEVGRVTGLDPAGPGFFDGKSTEFKVVLGTKTYTFGWDGAADQKLKDERIGRHSAAFVDIIHTNGGWINEKWLPIGSRLGAFENLGHVDFYPNGGV